MARGVEGACCGGWMLLLQLYLLQFSLVVNVCDLLVYCLFELDVLILLLLLWWRDWQCWFCRYTIHMARTGLGNGRQLVGGQKGGAVTHSDNETGRQRNSSVSHDGKWSNTPTTTTTILLPLPPLVHKQEHVLSCTLPQC